MVEAAIALADRDGIDALSMRRLAQALGIEAMSLYTHVRSKDDLLDGMVEEVVGRFAIANDGPDWQTSLRGTILSARAEMLRHPWAPGVIETRTEPGPATLRYLNGVMGILREGGFAVDLTHHALHVLGSRLSGFTQDLYDDSEGVDPEVAAAVAANVADSLPYVAEMALAVTHEGRLGGCDDDLEFAVGLDLILDGLERLKG